MEIENKKDKEERKVERKEDERREIKVTEANGIGIKNGEELQRITVSREAQNALGSILDRVNDGFAGGRVNRTQMANWIMLRFNTELDEVQIKEIRAEHFDEVAMLESILRQAKESGKVPSEFKALLQKQLGMDEPSKKKATRP
jgi:pyruvate formate-lyase activating enzyme-like uncharacterized protein